MGYINDNNREKSALIGRISSLLQELQKLSPHPDQPQNNGPLFLKSSDRLKVANDHDGMLGSMMMESFLGAAFSEAASEMLGSWVEDIDITNAVECYSAYITDVEATKIAAHGQGSLAKYAGKTLSNRFNQTGMQDHKMQSFLADLPQRLQIERNLASCMRALEALEVTDAYKDTADLRLAC